MAKEEKTLSDNELIAEFMGWKLNSIGAYGYYRQFDKYLYNPLTGNDRSHHPEHLAFHVSWDWLMPVVEKIKEIQPQAFKIDLFSGPLSPLAKLYIHSPMAEVYKAVVEFIKWYNKQK